MATDRLTLFDVIVDLIPGIIFLLFLLPFFSEESITGATSTVLSGAIVLLALGYAVGRIIHATAARTLVKSTITMFAWWIGLAPVVGWFLGSSRLRDIRKSDAESPYDAVHTKTHFEFKERIESVLSMYEDDDEPDIADTTDYEHVIIRELLDNAETELDFCEEREEEDSLRLKWESNLKYLEHLGHSLLHGESTLYQRYTILTTFYRNLWVAILLGGLVNLGLNFSGIAPQGGEVDRTVLAVSIGGGILILILLSVRWLEFRYRRLRALINDMYLISDTLGRELTSADGDD